MIYGCASQSASRPLPFRRGECRAAKDRNPGRPSVEIGPADILPPLDPEKLDDAMSPMKGGVTPTKAGRQIGLGRSTLYREIRTNAKG
jgi:hypothetical protein